MPQAQTVAALIIPTLLPDVPAANIVKPAATAAVVNIAWGAAPVVYAKKERSKRTKAINLLQPGNAKPLPKKGHAVAVKRVAVAIAGNMEGNLFEPGL